MKRWLTILLLMLSWALGCTEQRQVTLEFRIAEDQPAPGLEEIIFNRPDMRFYLHREVLVDETDVDSAFATVQNGRPAVELLLTAEGSRRFEELTEQNVGKRCGMILDGTLVSAPRIGAILAGDFSELEARSIARALTNR